MADYSLDQRLDKLSRTSNGLGHIQMMLDRGDFADHKERLQVKSWLKAESKRQRRAFLQTPEGSAIRQADYAARAVWLSVASLLVSLSALWVSLVKQ